MRSPADSVLDAAREAPLLEQLGDLDEVGDEGEAPHAREVALELEDEPEPEAREVARGERDVQEDDQARALVAAPPHHRLERHALVAQVRSQRPGHVDPAGT